MESRLTLSRAEDSPTAQEALVLAQDFISYRLGKGPLPSSNTAATLRKLADQIEEQYPSLLSHLCRKLNITRTTAYPTFVEIASEVFVDGINWGRIVALFAFGGKLALYCDQNQMKDLVASVTEWVGKYVGGLSEWIESHGGWEGLNKHFNDKGQDAAWWRGVFLTTLGLGTLAAFMYSRTPLCKNSGYAPETWKGVKVWNFKTNKMFRKMTIKIKCDNCEGLPITVNYSNGNRTEWSSIRSVIIQVKIKSEDHAAGDRFVYHEHDYRPNNFGRLEVLLPINHKITISEKRRAKLTKSLLSSKILSLFKGKNSPFEESPNS